MLRRMSCLVLVGIVLAGLLSVRPTGVQAQQAAVAQWIWFDEGNPLAEAPSETRYFRRVFPINRPVPNPVDEAKLEITADNSFTAYVNGVKVGEGDEWSQVYGFDVKKHLVHGQNVIAVAGKNDGGPAGLFVRLTYIPNGMSRHLLVSDGEWKSAKEAGKGWEKLEFDDSKWKPARVLGAVGKTGPWTVAGGKKSKAPSADRFTVPPGFKVEQIVKTPENDPNFSLVNLCFDAKGRLLVSREQGPTLLCTEPDKNGVLQKVKPYCEQVKNSQGMCWVDDALLLVGNGPKGTGLYRCRDTKNADQVDTVELIHSFQGGMAEHGPHAVIHGPDDKLYLVIGNHAWAKPEKLADNSPLRRWPTGQMGPDQGKAGSTEDVLLPRLNDARGHAANILAPGGTIWRMDKDGKNISLFCAGFRNQFDAAFNPDGELFTFDSDMEWDEALPWYRPVRVVHCVAGGEYGWRTGASKIPPYALDTLPPLVDTGRGSPVGVECYNHEAFPEKYRGAVFLADWSIGALWVVHPEKNGASYTSKAEKFCTGAPMNVTDVAVAPDGSLWFTLGGRGTAGGVFRISWTGDKPKTSGARQPLAAWSPDRGKFQAPTPIQKAEALAQLKAADPTVRRRACEAMIRFGIEPEVNDVWPLLADRDRFVQSAARLVLERIDPSKWVERIAKEDSPAALQAIVALCKIGKAGDHADVILDKLNRTVDTDAGLLAYLRTLQLALFHIPNPSAAKVKEIAGRVDKLFPNKDPSVNRELAILLTHLARTNALTTPVPAKLVAALQASEGDRPQQIHYAYCLRLIKDGWTPADRSAFTRWYDSTSTWSGGASFTPFLENIYRETLDAFPLEDRKAILAAGVRHPLPALVLAQKLQNDRTVELLPALRDLSGRVASAEKIHRKNELQDALAAAMVRTALQKPTADNLPYLVAGLDSSNKLLVGEVVDTLKKSALKPKADDPAPFRAAILASNRLDEKQRWKAVELLRHWTNGRQFGADDGDWKAELTAWGRWFGQSFPKEPALPDVAGDRPVESKYKFADLVAYLDGEGKTGDVARGRAVFEKAQCIKCHKYGNEGEGLGPDLTTLSKRFKRFDTLEALFYPSKTISDQYRSTTIVTKKGQTLNGLAAPQGDTVTVLLQDGTKVTLKKEEIDQQFASLVSVMPEKLLDTLTQREIADLFAFLESEPGK